MTLILKQEAHPLTTHFMRKKSSGRVSQDKTFINRKKTEFETIKSVCVLFCIWQSRTPDAHFKTGKGSCRQWILFTAPCTPRVCVCVRARVWERSFIYVCVNLVRCRWTQVCCSSTERKLSMLCDLNCFTFPPRAKTVQCIQSHYHSKIYNESSCKMCFPNHFGP